MQSAAALRENSKGESYALRAKCSTIWYVDSRVADGKAVLVAPKEPLPISRVCHDPDVMQRVYDIGRKAGEETLSNKPEFIKEA